MHNQMGLITQRNQQASPEGPSNHMQSSKLGGSPMPVACKIVHGRIKWVVPQVRRACEQKVI
jgi:hypothetical protein